MLSRGRERGGGGEAEDNGLPLLGDVLGPSILHYIGLAPLWNSMDGPYNDSELSGLEHFMPG